MENASSCDFELAHLQKCQNTYSQFGKLKIMTLRPVLFAPTKDS